MIMMAHCSAVAVTMSMAVSTLCSRGAGKRKAGRNDQRRGERKFLHCVLQWGERICPFSERTARS
ncbi:hypothetical protein ACM42_04835 [Bradyrhizobium sp. CCBAU 25338]|jgi:hypothetical protein|nr:hypothetical protein [Bradyrhizobium sp. CCBAU 25338]